jgi:hypothetical protein
MKGLKINQDAMLIGAAALAGLGLIVWASRAGMTQRLASGAVGVVNDVAVGTVKGLGQVVGIPDTNMSACQRALADGNYLEASFQCPAGTFISQAPVQAVKSVGSLVGVPDTNMTQCQRDINAGEWWNASFSCPAGTFLGAAGSAAKNAVFGSTAINQAQSYDASRVDYYAA